MSRCTSPPGDLDQPDPLLRSSEHTNVCKAAFDLKTLWERYGIVGDVTASRIFILLPRGDPLSHLVSHLPSIFLMQIFMS